MCSHHVPKGLLLCSQKVPQVPKLFLKTFPIAPSIYPIWFAPSSTLYINWKGGAIGEHICFYFATRVKKNASIEECPMFQSFQWWANQYGSFKRKWKSCECTHDLINMNHYKVLVFLITIKKGDLFCFLDLFKVYAFKPSPIKF